jgi:hypothetical protein
MLTESKALTDSKALIESKIDDTAWVSTEPVVADESADEAPMDQGVLLGNPDWPPSFRDVTARSKQILQLDSL